MTVPAPETGGFAGVLSSPGPIGYCWFCAQITIQDSASGDTGDAGAPQYAVTFAPAQVTPLDIGGAAHPSGIAVVPVCPGHAAALTPAAS